ncbi:hypothetical protein [Zobellella sp. An-6]|uniref:hypothetical protein n=1 Tax=Zobellella sp. An-6 TaxID=3400218 RepID=UPI0040412318
MSYPHHDITLTEGAEFALSLQLSTAEGPLDLTGYTISAQITAGVAEHAPVLAGFTVLQPNPAGGECYLTLEAHQTAALVPAASPTEPHRTAGYYQVRLRDPAQHEQIVLGGTVTYQQTITRST